MEVVCAGRLTTYPGRSKYQLVIESVELAGIGALLKLLEERKKKLEAEGLFAPERKKPLPYLPSVIGVVTSPTGAVIRDILHRLDDRFPRRVLVWPVAVQGEGAAEQVAAAIAGFNALSPGGAVPRPDLLIVARGGGSLEDLMAFNEEIVVRAAAASAIPLISAVGHETDTTLIDFAADKRAPTPTAAAEMAVPVRSELIAEIGAKALRLSTCVSRWLAERRNHVAGLGRGLPDPVGLIGNAAQKLVDRAERLSAALFHLIRADRTRLDAASSRMSPAALNAPVARARERLEHLPPRLYHAAIRLIERRHERVEGTMARLQTCFDAIHRKLESGYAIVSAEGKIVTSAAQIAPGAALTLEFHDGKVGATAEGAGKRGKLKTPSPAQGKLLGFALALLLAGTAQAGTLNLVGTPEQGALLRGQVDRGATVTLDGKPIRVAPDGDFIVGFGRDAPGEAALDVVYADGMRAHRVLAVAARQWDIRRIEGLPKDMVTPSPAELQRIKTEENLANAARAIDSDALAFEGKPQWPVIGKISGVFGSQTVLDGVPHAPHTGVDIAAPAGSPVKASLAGKVTLAAPDFFLTGGTVIIDHGYGLSSVYVHLASLAVKKGEAVRQGQIIGTLGATGRATGPNLHWGINWFQVRLDPERLAGPMPKE
jgi:exodeoxyribonuclease VII large subunit